MNIKKLILISLLAIELLTVCTYKKESFNPIVIPTITIAKNNLYGNGGENIGQENFVISDVASWNELKQKMNTSNNVTQYFSETSIDFSRYQILAVFDVILTNGGHSIDIIDVLEYDTEIRVNLNNLQRGGLTNVITQPFHIVKIPKQEKPIAFY